MKFFMYSKCGEGAGLLLRLQDEENKCRLFIHERDYSSVYDGLLDKSSGPIDHDEIVIFDSSGFGGKADGLRKSGYKVFGASKFADQLENDREFGLDFMKAHGINVPSTNNFYNFSKGKEFIKANPKKRYVFKPSGDLPSRLTYCGSDEEDLIKYLEYIEKFYKKDITDFILQEFIEGSIISTEVWCGPDGFGLRPNHTVEVKKLMNDDLGPSTGCSGNLIWLCDWDDPIVQLLNGCEDSLVEEGFCGPIDINCIVSDGKPYGLEWTPRFGLDAMPTLLQMINGDVGKIISDIVNTEDVSVGMENVFAGGVRVAIPPYPIEVDNTKKIQTYSPNKEILIRGLDYYNTYFYEVMKKGEDLVHSDGTGVIAVVSDTGDDPEDCFTKPYEILEDCKIPDKMYRTDLGNVLPSMYDDIIKELENVNV